MGIFIEKAKDQKETRPYCRIKSAKLEIEGYGSPYGSGLDYCTRIATLFRQLEKGFSIELSLEEGEIIIQKK